jgi:ATP-dependent protease Clp ATPase subunit
VSAETCSFCGRARSECEFLIAGPPFQGNIIYICDQCADIITDIATTMRAEAIATKEPA